MAEEKQLNTYLTAAGYSSLAVVSIFLVFINIPDALLYARSGIMRWVPFVLIFGVFPFSLKKTLHLFIPKYSFLIAVGSLLILGPMFGIQLPRFDQLALERDGLITTGEIVKKWEFVPTNRDAEWVVEATFEVKGQGYATSSIVDEQNALKEHQEIEIIYSETNPNINTFHYIYMDNL